MPIRRTLIPESQRPTIDPEVAMRNPAQPVAVAADGPNDKGVIARWMAPFIGKATGMVVGIETLTADTCFLAVKGRMGNKDFNLPFEVKQGRNVVPDNIDLLTGDIIKLTLVGMSRKDGAEPVIEGVCWNWTYEHRRV